MTNLTYGTYYRADPGPNGELSLTQWRGYGPPHISYPGVHWVADGEMGNVGPKTREAMGAYLDAPHTD